MVTTRMASASCVSVSNASREVACVCASGSASGVASWAGTLTTPKPSKMSPHNSATKRRVRQTIDTSMTMVLLPLALRAPSRAFASATQVRTMWLIFNCESQTDGMIVPQTWRQGGNDHAHAGTVSRAVVLPVSYTHLRAHETDSYLVCRLL